MADEDQTDLYDTLQISATAEPETIHRVYRLLAQRYHPDNAETGNDARFRALTDAYHTLSDPERRAAYDIVRAGKMRHRTQIVSAVESENDYEVERLLRLTILEVLYSKRRLEPEKPGVSPLELEQMIGRPREHLEFSTWYLVQRKFVGRSDNSSLVITADGVEYLEQNQGDTLKRRRLTAGSPAA